MERSPRESERSPRRSVRSARTESIVRLEPWKVHQTKYAGQKTMTTDQRKVPIKKEPITINGREYLGLICRGAQHPTSAKTEKN